MPPFVRAAAVLALVALVAGACETTTSPPAPDPPTPTEFTIPGTLGLNGANTHVFTTTMAGEINVRLQTLSPIDTVTVGMGLGTWSGTSCNVLIADDEAIQNELLIGTGTAPGQFCVRIFDAGKLAAPTDYTIFIRHF